MFLSLFVCSIFLSLGVSILLVWLFGKPIEAFLQRFIVDPMVCTVWSKYIKFAIVAVGVSTGTRVQMFQDYLSAPSWNKQAIVAQATEEFWALELYRTIAGTVIGLAWLMLAFCVMVLIAKVTIKPADTNEARAAAEADKSERSVFGASQR